jgi:DNA-directed RNA polymerase alpha subunit
MHELRTHNLYALEDFTQASEDELQAMPNVGRSTVVQIRSHLHALGLDFRQSENPKHRAHNQAALAQKLPPSERRTDDDAPITGIGLRPMTASKCLNKGIQTVGALRSMTLRELWVGFGEKSLLELVETLEAVGLELASSPKQLEKWKYKAIRPEKLVMPEESEPIEELEPWLGAICGHLRDAGVLTGADARALVQAGNHKVRGIGPDSWRRLQVHFSIRA